MRALRNDGLGKGPRVVQDAPEPSLAPGEALVKPTRVAITPADARAAGMPVEDARRDKPAVAQGKPAHEFIGTLGHQFVGVVKKVNVPADATPSLAARKALVGKRVVCSPSIVCGTCDLCRGGLSAHCRSRLVMGLHGRDGALAELTAAPLTNLFAVPDSVSDDKAVFAVMLASALHAAAMLRAENKSYITVLGDSALALLTGQVLMRLNKSVRVLGSRQQGARLCEKWGIKHRPMDEAGRRQDQDVVVDCTGTSGGLRLAMQLVRPRGTILLKSSLGSCVFPAGRPLSDAPDAAWSAPALDLTMAAANELQIIGSRDGPLPDAMGLLAEDAADVTSLIAKKCRLDDAPAALAGAAAGVEVAVVEV